MKENTISIIIPVYNMENYLKDCLDSVLCEKNVSMEVICIDDGSTDGSRTILEDYSKEDNRIKIIAQSNQGLSAARNTGLRAANGKWCYFLDSDDSVHKGAIRKMAEIMSRDNLDIFCFGGEVSFEAPELEYEYPKEIELWERRVTTDIPMEGKDYFELASSKNGFTVPVQIQCFSRMFLVNTGLEFTEGFIYEDLAFSFKAMMLAKRVLATDEVLFRRRFRRNSIVTSEVGLNNLTSRFTAYYDVITFCEAIGEENKTLSAEIMKYQEKLYSGLLNTAMVFSEEDFQHVLFHEEKKKQLFQELKNNIKNYMRIPGYGQNLNQKDYVILVGAGEIGRRALTHLGNIRVAYFADNDPHKIGTFIDGIEVIPIDDLYKYYDQYDIVLSMKLIPSVNQQLISQGIEKRYRFKAGRDYDLEIILTEENVNKYKKIALYGTGKEATFLKTVIENDRLFKLSYVIENDDSSMIGKYWRGQLVKKLDDVKNEVDCIIVGTKLYNMAVETRLRRSCNGNYTIINPFARRSYRPKNQLLINDYQYEDYEAKTEEAYHKKVERLRDHFDALDAYVDEVEKMSELPLFGHVEIETVNRCNGSCSFCPVNKNIDPRPFKIMEDEVFEKIILELEKLNYSGRIAPFSNNEPFIDPKIIERTKFIREHLPLARIHLFTNGSLLTIEKYIEIMKYLDEIIIDNYNQDLELNETVKAIYDYCKKNPKMIEKTDIVLRKQEEILSSRGGDAPNRKNKKVFEKLKCCYPYRQLVIRPTGEVSLCCNDPLGKTTLGDVKKQTLLEIWYGDRFNEVRKMLLGGRVNYPHCEFCDWFTLD